jgi:hypothetical protein
MIVFTPDQVFKIARILQDGHYGSFMSSIGCALQLADSDNREKLLNAFNSDLARVYANAQDAERLESKSI